VCCPRPRGHAPSSRGSPTRHTGDGDPGHPTWRGRPGRRLCHGERVARHVRTRPPLVSAAALGPVGRRWLRCEDVGAGRCAQEDHVTPPGGVLATRPMGRRARAAAVRVDEEETPARPVRPQGDAAEHRAPIDRGSPPGRHADRPRVYRAVAARGIARRAPVGGRGRGQLRRAVTVTARGQSPE